MTKRDPDFEKEQGEVYGRVWKEEREGRCDVKYIGATKYKLQLFFVLFVCVVCFNHPKINLYQNAKKIIGLCTHVAHTITALIAPEKLHLVGK